MFNLVDIMNHLFIQYAPKFVWRKINSENISEYGIIENIASIKY